MITRKSTGAIQHAERTVATASATGVSPVWKIPKELIEYPACYLRAEQEGAEHYNALPSAISGGPANIISFSGLTPTSLFTSAALRLISVLSTTDPPSPSTGNPRIDSAGNGGLSTGAEAGIGDGAAIGGLLLGGGASLLGKRAGCRFKKAQVSKQSMNMTNLESQATML
jgi:hypothetical protein